MRDEKREEAPPSRVTPRPMTPAEEHRFRELVGRHFGGAAPDDHGFGLDELACKCLGAKPWEWETVVKAHFESVGAADSVDAIDAAKNSLSATLLDYAVAEPRLLAAPMSLEAAEKLLPTAERSGLVYRRDLARLPTVLLLESPDGKPSPVAKAQFLDWGRRPSELFRVALRNVRARLRLRVEPIVLGGSHAGVVIRSESQLTSACAYFLPRIKGTLGAVGSMLVVPHPRCVLAAPVDGPIHFQEVGKLLIAASRRDLRSEEPSPDAYFWDGKRFYLNAAKITGEPVDGSREMLTGTP